MRRGGRQPAWLLARRGIAGSARSGWYDTCRTPGIATVIRRCKNMTSPFQPDQHPGLRPVPQIMRNPHFERIGGEAPIRRLAERFYHHMDTLPEAAGIRALHAPDLSHARQVLERFLTEWMGGPRHYSAERGHPRLRMKHAAFPIGEAERDAWMLCMRRALADVVPDATLRRELEHAFFKTADFIRNDARETHA